MPDPLAALDRAGGGALTPRNTNVHARPTQSADPLPGQYKVEKGDGVEVVARKHGITPAKLVKANPVLQARDKDVNGLPELDINDILEIPRPDVDDHDYYARRAQPNGAQVPVQPTGPAKDPKIAAAERALTDAERNYEAARSGNGATRADAGYYQQEVVKARNHLDVLNQIAALPTQSGVPQDERAMRQSVVTSYFGGTINGTVWPSPDKALDVPINELAATLSQGNPLEFAVYASVYGGTDPLTKQSYPPAWEKMGISKEAFAAKLVDAPWEIASHHLGKPLSEQDYNRLQAIQGPLGHMMNMGVDPKVALPIQATWSAHFHGGYDPVTRSTLQPVWERWGLQNPDQLKRLFRDNAQGTLNLPHLVGGVDLRTGRTIEAPWQRQDPSVFGASQLKQAETILGISANGVTIDKSAFTPEEAEWAALGFTTPSASSQAPNSVSYLNPMEFAQSPTFRNGKTFKDGDIIVSNLMDPMGGLGLFGLAKGYPRWFQPKETDSGEDKRRIKVQGHGLAQIVPLDGGVTFLGKLQRIPKAKEGETIPPMSQFIKTMGNWNDSGGGITFFIGRGDEAEGSRGRQPGIAGVSWMNAADGSLQQFGIDAALPQTLYATGKGGKPVLGAGGLNFSLAQDQNGNWIPNGGGLIFEGGARRIQIQPSITFDPNTGDLNGISIWGGTGWTLGEFSVQSSISKPQSIFSLTGGGADGQAPSLTYTDPSSTSVSLGGMYGTEGRALGVGGAGSSHSNVAVTVDVVGNDISRAGEIAKDYHGKIVRGEISYLDLPAGIRVASDHGSSTSIRGTAFFSYVNVGGSLGGGENIITDVRQDVSGNWTVGHYKEPLSEWSWQVGIFGIGPGQSYSEAHLRGESLSFNAQNGPMDAATREALDAYASTGMLPGAMDLQGKFQGGDAARYAGLVDEHRAAKDQLQRANAVPTGTPLRDGDINAASLRTHETGKALNDFVREHLKPGDQLMPGVKVESISSRDRETTGDSFLIPMGSETITRGRLDRENNSFHTYEFAKVPLFGADSSHQSQWRTGAGEDYFRLSGTGEVGFDDHLPFMMINGLANKSVYMPQWQAVAAGGDPIRGSISISFTDGQLVSLGQSLGQGSGGQALWTSMANRASGALTEDFAGKNPEYLNNGMSAFGERPLLFAADGIAKKHNVEVTADLAAKFAAVDSPDAFKKLSIGEQQTFIGIVSLTRSADHSPYEALLPASYLPTEAARSQAFAGIVEGFAQPSLALSNDRHLDLGNLPFERRGQVTSDDPTVEFVRFLKENVSDSMVRDPLLKQAGFTAELPPEIQQYRGKTIDELTKLAKEVYFKPFPYQRGMPSNMIGQTYTPLPQGDAIELAGMIVAVGEQKGSEGAWKFVKDNKIDVSLVFNKMGDDDNGNVVRHVLADVLAPGAIGQDAPVQRLIQGEVGKANDARESALVTGSLVNRGIPIDVAGRAAGPMQAFFRAEGMTPLGAENWLDRAAAQGDLHEIAMGAGKVTDRRLDNPGEAVGVQDVVRNVGGV